MAKSKTTISVSEEEAASQGEATEQVVQIPLAELHPFEGHPFKVLDDESMEQTVESIKQIGIAVPLIVRPDPDGGYEILSGHRRHHAAEIAGFDTVPVIVKDLDDDASIKHQGSRADRTSTQVVEKLSAEQVGEEAGMSRESIRRYIRLTNLIPEVLDMVDNKEIAFNPAVELSFLKPEEQKLFMEAKDAAQTTPSLSQAQRLKKLSQDGECTLEKMCDIMDEVKKGELDHVTIKNDVLRKYFPKSYTPKQMENTIIRLLEQWQRKKQRDQML